MLNLDDRETVAQITENMYLQYFHGGYSSYNKQPQTGGQATGKALGKGSGKPRRTLGKESDSGQVWTY